MSARRAALLLLAAQGCGAPAQPADCESYLRCARTLQVADLDGLESSFGTSGSCWSSGRATASACGTFCRTNLESLRAAHPDAEACR